MRFFLLATCLFLLLGVRVRTSPFRQARSDPSFSAEGWIGGVMMEILSVI